MPGIIILFVLGVGLFQFSPILPPLLWFIALGLGAALIFGRYAGSRLPLALLLGVAWAGLYAHWLLSDALPTELERQDLIVKGVVASIPEIRKHSIRFEFRVQTASLDGVSVSVPSRIRLNWYRNAPSRLEPGQHWQLRVRLRRPHGFVNPGGFDYEGWLFRRGIGAVGYVRKANTNILLDAANHWVIDRGRQRLRDRLSAVLQGTSGARFVPALVIGDKSQIERDDWTILAQTGTNHLFAISGLHIGIVSGLAFVLFSWLWRRVPLLILYFPAASAGAIAALFAALIYAGLAGFSLPTQRALIMVVMLLGSGVLRRNCGMGRALLMALFIIVFLDPLSVLAPGLWLSFGAVFAILYVTAYRSSAKTMRWHLVRIQFAITVGLAPLLLLIFNQASIVSPLVNLIAVPWFSLVIIPLALLGTLLLSLPVVGEMLLLLVSWLLDLSFSLLRIAASDGMSIWVISWRPSWIWLPAFVAGLLLLAPKGTSVRWLFILLLMPLFLLRPQRPAPGDVWFYLLDVGQGLAAVVQTHGHTLVYDTGPIFSSSFNAGSAVLAPFLRQRGIEKIDTVILSHGDSDHVGGFRGLRAVMPFGRVLVGEPDRPRFENVDLCDSTQKWAWDGVEFQILHPQLNSPFQRNNRSCVLTVSNRAGQVLLPGDIERAAEDKLLERRSHDLQSRILIAPHHGSKTSSSAAFIDQVRPEYVLYSAGYLNRFNLPKQEVMERWTRVGARAYNTAKTGGIEFRLLSDGRLEGPILARKENRHYWAK